MSRCVVTFICFLTKIISFVGPTDWCSWPNFRFRKKNEKWNFYARFARNYVGSESRITNVWISTMKFIFTLLVLFKNFYIWLSSSSFTATARGRKHEMIVECIGNKATDKADITRLLLKQFTNNSRGPFQALQSHQSGITSVLCWCNVVS